MKKRAIKSPTTNNRLRILTTATKLSRFSLCRLEIDVEIMLRCRRIEILIENWP